MKGILRPEISSKINFFFYRYRFLINYVIIGVISIILEIVAFRGLNQVGLISILSKTIGFLMGVSFSFWLNVRYNFRIPNGKRNKALLYFCGISLFSFGLNFIFKAHLESLGLSYGQARLVSSGLLFSIGYGLHRRYSFQDYKKVCVAIYANGVEDIENIFKKVGHFPDIIHADIADKSFTETEHDILTYRLEVKKAYWPNKPLHAHLMSKNPSKWIPEIAKYSDLLMIHFEIDEDIDSILNLIQSNERKAGLAVTMKTDIHDIRPYLPKVDTLLLLTIPTPGRSGQSFCQDALPIIEEINSWPERSSFNLCIDGGVNEANVGILNAEMVVSGSAVLNHPNPPQQIMRLQTSANYEKI
jgi:ribulose-phosphate 3-epimerase